LTEASEGKLGTMKDKLLLFCFHYDPARKGYVPFARNLMKAGGGLMVLMMGIAITVLFRRERRGALSTGVATAK
jgi:protein SCO1/2